MSRYQIVLLALVLGACSGNEQVGENQTRLAGLSADSLFYAVERQLLDGEETVVDFHITAEGAFQADLRGRLRLQSGNRAELSAMGTVGSDSADLHLVSDGSEMVYGNGVELKIATPSGLNESIAVGMARMGLLHNLVRLFSNEAPDHPDGTVMEWVQVTDLSRLDGGADALGIQFTLVVSGVASGTALLKVDDETGETIVREQTVQFPDGEMRVVERYVG